jgi:cell wall-associated NlpC family hydrolase
MSVPAHRAPKVITRRKATAVAVVGLSAGSVALIPSSSQAATLAQAKAQYRNDLATSEAAGQVYDQQEQAYAELQKKIDDLQDEIGEQDRQIAALDSTIGLMAAQQYRNGGMSDTLELTLAASPDTYLDKAAGQQEIASQEAKQLRSAAADQTQLRQENALAATLVRDQGQALQAAKSALAQANDATASAKTLLASLTPSAQAPVTAGSGGPGSGTSYNGPLPAPSGRAAAAVAYAESKVGDEYVTGGNGPDEFDCSGLVQEAWKAAGVSIERTTYEQWDTLQHIPASALEPGDLIFFNWNSALDGPGHVALYIGNGMYIQATHPGSDVQWASLDPSSPSYGDMSIVGYARVT